MCLIENISFVVIDVETTGSDPRLNRIFDIACIRVENEKIIDDYYSLVNPHQFIPPFISKLTGVSNKQVYSAPEPREVFSKVHNFLYAKPSIFVAHNASFDFSFIKNSFNRINLEIDLPVLCTLKLARKLLPKDLKKNVGFLANYFFHDIENRHRAYDDCLATVTILNELIKIAKTDFDISTIQDLLAFQNKPVRATKVKSQNTDAILKKIEHIPNEAGFFNILDKEGNVLFSSETNFLQSRLFSFFGYDEQYSKKIARIIKNSYDISWKAYSDNENLFQQNTLFDYLSEKIKL